MGETALGEMGHVDSSGDYLLIPGMSVCLYISIYIFTEIHFKVV